MHVAGYAAGKEFDLINPKKLPGGKKAKKGYKNSGTLQLMSASVVNPVGFVEHLQRGLMINFSVGIDFTGSNGDPTQPVGAPRGPLHGGRSTRAAPRGPLHEGRSTGRSQIFF